MPANEQETREERMRRLREEREDLRLLEEEDRIALRRQKRISDTRSAIVGVFLILFVTVLIAASEDEPESPKVVAAREKEKRCGDEITAVLRADSLVKQSLRSPSTAEFPNQGYYQDRVYSPECGTFIVSGEVDAMNGFGAILRHGYTAKVVYDFKTDSWRGNVDFKDD